MTLVDNLAAWQVVENLPQPFLTVEGFDAEHVVVATQDATGRQTVTVTSASGQRSFLLKPRSVPQSADVLPDGTVVFGVGDDDNGDYWVYEWQPQAAAPRLVYQSTGAGAFFGEAVTLGPDVYLTDKQHEGAICLERLNLANPAHTLSTVECANAGDDLGYLHASDGTLSYKVGNPNEECGSLHRFTPGQLPQVARVPGCFSRGTASADLAAWTEDPTSGAGGADYSHAPFRAFDGGRMVDLGNASAGTAVICAGQVYWTWMDSRGLEPSQIRRWSPGSPVEVVYQAPPLDGPRADVTSPPMCSAGYIGVQQMAAGPEGLVTTFLRAPIP